MSNIIITTYLTGHADPQRKDKWAKENLFSEIKTLSDSCEKLNIPLVVLCDFDVEKEHYATFIRVECDKNPYFARWSLIANYLQDNEPVDMVFHLDATDTEVLKDPFTLKGDFYIGSEQKEIDCDWILSKHKASYIDRLRVKHGRKKILNAGIVGGEWLMMYHFCVAVESIFGKYGDDYTDIPAINKVCYGEFHNVFKTGPEIHTVFKAYEKNNKTAIFRHK